MSNPLCKQSTEVLNAAHMFSICPAWNSSFKHLPWRCLVVAWLLCGGGGGGGGGCCCLCAVSGGGGGGVLGVICSGLFCVLDGGVFL